MHEIIGIEKKQIKSVNKFIKDSNRDPKAISNEVISNLIKIDLRNMCEITL
jgi:hypothetical protein